MHGAPDPVAGAALSPQERARAARFHFDLHRNRYIERHGWWRDELARRLHAAPGDISYLTGAHGKPVLGGPLQGRLRFNASSSQDFSLLGLDWRGEIGVDIECIRPFKDAAAFAAAHYSEQEQAGIRAGGRGESASQRLFYRIWTRKEAFLKCTGLGLVDDLANLHVGSRNSRRPCRYRDASGAQHVCYLWTWVLDDPQRAVSVASPRPLPLDLQPETVNP